MRRVFQLSQALDLDLLDLVVNETQMRHLAGKLGQCVGWNGASLRRAQRCKPLRCFAQFRIEAANAETHQGGLHPVDDAGALANQLLALAGRAFRILLFQCGDSGHAGVFLLAAQPTEQRPFEQPNIQPIGLRASPLPGDRNAGRMNDISFDPSTAQPTRQPEPITTRFKRDDQSGDRLASCNRLIAPAVQQREQSFLVGCQLFQRFSLDTRNHSAYQPSCGTEFDNRYQCLILLKGDEGPAEVIFRLRHGATPSSGCSDDGATPRRPPHSIYIGRIGKPPGPMLDDYAARVSEGVVWVLENDTAIAGIIVLLPAPDYLLLDNIAVSPPHQGAGFGRRLLAFAEAEALRRGYREIRLYTHQTMVENQRLYASIGYEETGRGTAAGYDRVFMRKPASRVAG